MRRLRENEWRSRNFGIGSVTILLIGILNSMQMDLSLGVQDCWSEQDVSTTSRVRNDGVLDENGVLALSRKTSACIQIGDEILRPLKKPEKAILVLGITGAGKTTLTQLIAGDLSNLKAYKPNEKMPHILIKDENNLISQSTYISKTIFPQLVHDNATNEDFYDCPGYLDTRSVPLEIANSYFIGRILHHSNFIKILLVENYSSFLPSNDRNRLSVLLDHLLQFLRKPKDFVHSIALVVTKVRAEFNDDEVLHTVAAALKSFEDSLTKLEYSHPPDTVRLVLESLLQKDTNDVYTNLQLLRQPKSEGLLSQNVAVKENRERIRKMIFQNPSFIYKRTNSSDFGFPLSTNARHVLISLLMETKTNIRSTIEELKTHMWGSLSPSDSTQKDVKDSYNDFLQLQKCLPGISQNLRAKDFMHRCILALKLAGVETPMDVVMRLENSIKYIQFCEDFHAQTTNNGNDMSEVSKALNDVLAVVVERFGFQNLKRHLETFSTNILTSFDSMLSKSTFEEMKDTTSRIQMSIKTGNQSHLSYSVYDALSYFQVALSSQNINSTDAVVILAFVKTFIEYQRDFLRGSNRDDSTSAILKTLENSSIMLQVAFKDLEGFLHKIESEIRDKLTDDEWDEDAVDSSDVLVSFPHTQEKLVSDLKSLQASPKFQVKPKNNVLLAKGGVVPLSQVVKALPSNASCAVVMASAAVTIDVDLNLPGKSMFIFAPTVHVVDDRKLNFDGIPGKDFVAAADPGKGGDTGPSGQRGGHFVIAALNIDGSGALTVSANGGKGAMGQEGGSGNYNHRNLVGQSLMPHQVQRHPNRSIGITGPFGKEQLDCCRILCTDKCDGFIAYGEIGRRGHDGMPGGSGGQGGTPGRVRIFCKDNSTNVMVQSTTNVGIPGDGGTGGRGGMGGRTGSGLLVDRPVDYYNDKMSTIQDFRATCKSFNLGLEMTVYADPQETTVMAEAGSDGPNGKPGTNTAQSGKSINSYKPCGNLASVYKKYKKYLQPKLSNAILRAKVQQYLDYEPLFA